MYTQNVTAQRKVTQQMKATARSGFESVKATISVLRAYFAARLTPVLGDERGEIASWVVVTALVVVAAIAIVGIVVGKLTTTANNIQTP
jgi:VIT1/CCC1 family predicted Fe2+/Mn2+ transporter